MATHLKAPRLGSPEYAAFARLWWRVSVRPEVVHCFPAGTYVRWRVDFPTLYGKPIRPTLWEDSAARAGDLARDVMAAAEEAFRRAPRVLLLGADQETDPAHLEAILRSPVIPVPQYAGFGVWTLPAWEVQ